LNQAPVDIDAWQAAADTARANAQAQLDYPAQWAAQARELETQLPTLIQLISAPGFDARLADIKRFQDEQSAEFLRVLMARKAAAKPK
jgi:hypothetical protein